MELALIGQIRAPDKALIYIYIMSISSPNPILNHLLEPFHQDGTNKCSNNWIWRNNTSRVCWSLF